MRVLCKRSSTSYFHFTMPLKNSIIKYLVSRLWDKTMQGYDWYVIIWLCNHTAISSLKLHWIIILLRWYHTIIHHLSVKKEECSLIFHYWILLIFTFLSKQYSFSFLIFDNLILCEEKAIIRQWDMIYCIIRMTSLIER